MPANAYWTRNGERFPPDHTPPPEWFRRIFIEPTLTPADHSFTDRPNNTGDDHARHQHLRTE